MCIGHTSHTGILGYHSGEIKATIEEEKRKEKEGKRYKYPLPRTSSPAIGFTQQRIFAGSRLGSNF